MSKDFWLGALFMILVGACIWMPFAIPRPTEHGAAYGIVVAIAFLSCGIGASLCVVTSRAHKQS